MSNIEHTEYKDKKQLNKIKKRIEELSGYKVIDIQCIASIEFPIYEIKGRVRLPNKKELTFKLESLKNEIGLSYLINELYQELKEGDTI